jgi:hypothetical protein
MKRNEIRNFIFIGCRKEKGHAKYTHTHTHSGSGITSADASEAPCKQASKQAKRASVARKTMT